MYRINWGIGHGIKNNLEAHKRDFTCLLVLHSIIYNSNCCVTYIDCKKKGNLKKLEYSFTLL